MELKEQLLSRVQQGKDAWNKWRQEHIDTSIDLSGVDFASASLIGYDFSECNLSNCNFSKADLVDARFISANLQHADFSLANLERSSFIAADLSHAKFVHAHLKKAKFLTAQLHNTDFSQVDFSGHALQGMDFGQAKLASADLSGQDLTAMNLVDVDLSRAILKGSNLTDANLQGANLSFTRLSDTELTGANLKYVNFTNSDLKNTDLSEINCSYANFFESDLRNANLEQANFEGANLTGARLHNIKNTGWNIKQVQCDYVFWDADALAKTNYRPNEFEKLNSESLVIELRYDNYMAPQEISTLPILVEHLEANHWGVKLRIQSIAEEAGGMRVRVAVEDTGGHNAESLEKELREEASHLLIAQLAMRRDHKLLAEYKESIAQLKNKYWPRLLEMAADSQAGQIRMMTVLLMDLTGFSRWQGDELSEKLTLFRGLINPILKRWQASYPNMEGDSLRASFQSAPVAVACASMIRNVLQAAGFPCRIGIDYGEVSLEHNEVTEKTDLSGRAVNFAARLESCCEAGEVLISENVWHFVRNHQEYFHTEPHVVTLEKAVGALRAGDSVRCYRVDQLKPLI